jgi:hypothetical protein
VYNNTPNGGLGSFWAAGAAPSVDDEGNIYLDAGNGTFDADTGGPDLGESFIKLSTSGGGLSVVDYFTPFNQLDLNRMSSTPIEVPLLFDSAGSPHHTCSPARREDVNSARPRTRRSGRQRC